MVQVNVIRLIVVVTGMWLLGMIMGYLVAVLPPSRRARRDEEANGN